MVGIDKAILKNLE